MAAFEKSAHFSETEKNVLRLATALARTPANVSDELFAALRRDLSERELLELNGAVAWENFQSRFNRTFAIEAEGFSRGQYCPLPER